jgi:glycosyltransferase involved in cell wall biosynthesis
VTMMRSIAQRLIQPLLRLLLLSETLWQFGVVTLSLCRKLQAKILRTAPLPTIQSTPRMDVLTKPPIIPTTNDDHRLLIDIGASASWNTRTGIQRMTRNMLYQLSLNPPSGYSVRPVCYSKGTYWYADLDNPIDTKQEDILLGIDPDLRMTRSHVNCLRQQKERGVKLYFVIHDLFPLTHPEWVTFLMSPMFGIWFQTASTLADGLVCNSQSTMKDVSGWFASHPIKRTVPLKLGYIYPGADIESEVGRDIPDAGKRLLSRLANHPSVLMVGTVEPRKGYGQAVEALDQLWREGLDILLVIVGKQGWMVDKLAKYVQSHPEFGERLFWLDSASDELLVELYRSTSVLLMASEGEGYGLPVAEAAKYGLPVIARDLLVFREIAKNNAYYFSGDLAKGVKDWLNLYQLGKHPKSDGIPWQTWEDSARQLKQLIAQWNAPL